MALASASPVAIAACVIASYLLGMLPTAHIIGRRRGVDPTATGSGNPGATNVFRTAGRSAGALTLVGDVAKGILAAGLGWAVGGHALGVACGVAAVVGHTLPVTRRFRGGKGVATGVGMALVLFPLAALAACILFAAVARTTRVVALGSIIATLSMPFTVAALGAPAREVVALGACAALIVARHHSNIARLLGGEGSPSSPGA